MYIHPSVRLAKTYSPDLRYWGQCQCQCHSVWENQNGSLSEVYLVLQFWLSGFVILVYLPRLLHSVFKAISYHLFLRHVTLKLWKKFQNSIFFGNLDAIGSRLRLKIMRSWLLHPSVMCTCFRSGLEVRDFELDTTVKNFRNLFR